MNKYYNKIYHHITNISQQYRYFHISLIQKTDELCFGCLYKYVLVKSKVVQHIPHILSELLFHIYYRTNGSERKRKEGES